MPSQSQAIPGPHAAAPSGSEALPIRRSRGPAARRVLRVCRQLAVIVVLLVVALYAGLLGMRWTRSAPLFEDPAAYIDTTNCSISPDGKTAYLSLQHPGRVTYRDSIWAVDLATLEHELLPDAALKLHPLMPVNFPCIGSVVSWDGQHMLGVLMQPGETSEFFCTDLASGRVESIDWATFDAGANAVGWHFERIRPLPGAGRGTVRATRHGDARAEPFILDTHREPAVAAADPMQIFYTASDGTVHHLDAEAGTDMTLDLLNQAGRDLRVSPDAGWLALSLGHGRAQLLEVSTGRSRTFEHPIHTLDDGDYPVLQRTDPRGNRWTQSGIIGDRGFETAVAVHTLRPVGGARFLGIDADTEAVYLLGGEGELLKTIREPTTHDR